MKSDTVRYRLQCYKYCAHQALSITCDNCDIMDPARTEGQTGEVDRKMRYILEPSLREAVYGNGRPAPHNEPPRFSRTLFQQADRVFVERLSRPGVPREVRDHATVFRRRELLQWYLTSQGHIYQEHLDRVYANELAMREGREDRQSDRARRRKEYEEYYARSFFLHSKRTLDPPINNKTRCVSMKASNRNPQVIIDVEGIAELMKNRHVSVVKCNKPPTDRSKYLKYLHVQMNRDFNYKHFEVTIRELPAEYVGVRLYTPHSHCGSVWKASAHYPYQQQLERSYLNHNGEEVDDDWNEVSDSEPGKGKQPPEDMTSVSEDTVEEEVPKDELKRRQALHKRYTLRPRPSDTDSDRSSPNPSPPRRPRKTPATSTVTSATETPTATATSATATTTRPSRTATATATSTTSRPPRRRPDVDDRDKQH